MRLHCSLLLLVAAVVPATARADAISEPGGTKATLTGAGQRVIATWLQRTAGGSRVMARPLDGRGRPLGRAHVIGQTRPGLAIGTAPVAVWNPRRRELLVGYQATGPREALRSCDPTDPGAYALPAVRCVQGDLEIYTRRVGLDGRPRGRATRVTSTGPPGDVLTTSNRPALAHDPRSGRTLLAFTAMIDPPRGRYVTRVQRLSPTGAPSGPVRQIGPDPPAAGGGGVSGTIGADPRDGFRVLFAASALGPDHLPTARLYVQRLSPAGVPRGGRTELAGPGETAGPPGTTNFRPQPSGVAVLPHPRTRRSLLVWQMGGFGPGSGFWSRLLGRDGRPATVASEIANSAGWTQAAFVPSGSGWTALLTRFVPGGERDVHLQRFSAAGRATGRATRLTFHAPAPGSQDQGRDDRFVFDPAIAVTDRGRLVGAWTEEPEGGRPQVHVRRLN